jgi:glycosyltransferase involved in cell wall biosynthesis
VSHIRVSILVPRPDTRTGNATSVARIVRLCDPESFSITVVDSESDEPIPACDVVHVYDAYRSGVRAPEGMPLVVTLAGTDVLVDHPVTSRREVIERVISRAKVVLTYNPALAVVAPHARVMPLSIDLREDLWDARKVWNVPRKASLIFVPGGLRPSKRNHLALEIIKAVPSAHVVLAGPVLDPAYASDFLHQVQHVVLPRESMWGAYASADVVCNLSAAEGVSNALAEAMWVGRPVLASDISGNRHALGDCGLYFGDPEELRQRAASLIEDPHLRGVLSRRAQGRARKQFSAADEKRAIEQAYREAAR